jgi:UDP-glucose 4-epimerase
VIMENKFNPFNVFASKKVLITGASGFIGNHLAHKLVQCNAEVHGTSRSLQKSRKKNIQWWQGSFEHLEDARRILKQINPDYVFHLSGEVTAASDPKYIIPTYHSLLTSTVNLLTVALEGDCKKIVLMGSATEPPEHDPVPSSPYSSAKWAVNFYGNLFSRNYGLPISIVRPFMGYGPTQSKSKLIPHVILSLLNGDDVPLTSGNWVMDWIYIDDLIDGIVAAALTEQHSEKAFDLGSGNLTSVRGIVENIVEIIEPKGKPLFGALPDRPMERCRIADLNYSTTNLNWKPSTSLKEGLRKTVDWYRSKLFDYKLVELNKFELQEKTAS